jgi:hypothetical protein
MLAFTRRIYPPRCVHVAYGPHPTISLFLSSFSISPRRIPWLARRRRAPAMRCLRRAPATRRHRAPATRRRRRRAPATRHRRRAASAGAARPAMPAPPRTSPSYGAAPPAVSLGQALPSVFPRRRAPLAILPAPPVVLRRASTSTTSAASRSRRLQVAGWLTRCWCYDHSPTAPQTAEVPLLSSETMAMLPSSASANVSRRRTSPELFLHNATIEDFYCYICFIFLHY